MSGGIGLLDVLQELCVAALDTLLDELSTSLPSVRLACKALRQFVDNNITEVSLDLRPNARQLPRLVLPRCKHLTIYPQVKDKGELSAAAALLLQTWPNTVKQQFTTLSMCDGLSRSKDAMLAAACILREMPALKEVELGRLRGGRGQRKLLLNALASLCSLQQLRIAGFYRPYNKDREEAQAVAELMSALPPSVEFLQLETMALDICSGTINRVTIKEWWEPDDIYDVSFQREAEQLLACNAMGPRLPRLRLEVVKVYDEPAEAPPAMMELLSRSDALKVGEMQLCQGASSEGVRSMLRQLGCWPEAFVPTLIWDDDLGSAIGSGPYMKMPEDLAAALPLLGPPRSVDEQQQQQQQQDVEVDDLLDTLFLKLDPTHGSQQSDSGRGEGTEPDPGSDLSQRPSWRCGRGTFALLLRGPWIEGLAAGTSGVDLDTWVQDSAVRAWQHYQRVHGTNETGANLSDGTYLLLPRGHGLLVCLRKREAAEAFEAMVMEQSRIPGGEAAGSLESGVAQSAPGEGTQIAVATAQSAAAVPVAVAGGAAGTGAGTAAGAALEALRLPEHCYSWGFVRRSHCCFPMGRAARQVVEDLWASSLEKARAMAEGSADKRGAIDHLLACLERILAFRSKFARLPDGERSLRLH